MTGAYWIKAVIPDETSSERSGVSASSLFDADRRPARDGLSHAQAVEVCPRRHRLPCGVASVPDHLARYHRTPLNQRAEVKAVAAKNVQFAYRRKRYLVFHRRLLSQTRGKGIGRHLNVDTVYVFYIDGVLFPR